MIVNKICIHVSKGKGSRTTFLLYVPPPPSLIFVSGLSLKSCFLKYELRFTNLFIPLHKI